MTITPPSAVAQRQAHPGCDAVHLVVVDRGVVVRRAVHCVEQSRRAPGTSPLPRENGQPLEEVRQVRAVAHARARVSVASGGAPENLFSFNLFASADGRSIAFESDACTLVGTDSNHDHVCESGDTNKRGDIFVRARQAGIPVSGIVSTRRNCSHTLILTWNTHSCVGMGRRLQMAGGEFAARRRSTLRSVV